MSDTQQITPIRQGDELLDDAATKAAINSITVNLAVFLASPREASHVSGTILGVTGGRATCR